MAVPQHNSPSSSSSSSFSSSSSRSLPRCCSLFLLCVALLAANSLAAHDDGPSTFGPETVTCDIAIAGGSTASLAAAITAAEADQSLTVCFTEITDWPGGQMTAGVWLSIRNTTIFPLCFCILFFLLHPHAPTPTPHSHSHFPSFFTPPPPLVCPAEKVVCQPLTLVSGTKILETNRPRSETFSTLCLATQVPAQYHPNVTSQTGSWMRGSCPALTTAQTSGSSFAQQSSILFATNTRATSKPSWPFRGARATQPKNTSPASPKSLQIGKLCCFTVLFWAPKLPGH